ncbi:cell division protein FtsQ/DivIB [Paenibacillus sp. UNC451MF]|uniref:cell division protein FtsQ/DivIB n=1 Tax=Paenibacillus sp. UNC451MF TaxID=1449063 RepID=UPI0005628DFF|nr:FtsQ-type POTRA domain-containing protein [Paenibacillus sp. UNC451MF]
MHQEQRLPVIQKPKTKKRSRSSKKLLLFLFLFFITLLCILFFQSSLSKITTVEVEGQELLTIEAVEQASGVKAGDHFFAVSSYNVEQQVKALKMVESATVTKHFPGVIHIEVKEYPRVAYQFGNANQPEAILADGSVVTVSGDINFIMDKPILTGWGSSADLKLQLCKALASAPASTLMDISEIKPDPSTSYPDRIKMYTRSQFEVVTTVSYLPEKLKYLDTYITNLKENKVNTGVLTLLEVDTHAPFEADGNKAQNGKDGKSDKKPSSNSQNGSVDPKKDPGKTASGKETPKN